MGVLFRLLGGWRLNRSKVWQDAALKLRGYDGGRICGDCLPDGTGYVCDEGDLFNFAG